MSTAMKAETSKTVVMRGMPGRRCGGGGRRSQTDSTAGSWVPRRYGGGSPGSVDGEPPRSGPSSVGRSPDCISCTVAAEPVRGRAISLRFRQFGVRTPRRHHLSQVEFGDPTGNRHRLGGPQPDQRCTGHRGGRARQKSAPAEQAVVHPSPHSPASTASTPSPYFASLFSPTPPTVPSSDMLTGLRAAISRRVASWNTT